MTLLIFKSYLRMIYRRVKKLKYYIFFSIPIFIYITIELIKNTNKLSNYFHDFNNFIYLGVFIYCVSKVLYGKPIVLIKPEFIELKIFNINQLKGIIFFKNLYISTIFFALSFYFEIFDFKISLFLYIINITSNFSVFMLNQIKFENNIIFKLIVLISLSISFYINNIYILLVLLILLLLYFNFLKKINNNDILNYYKSISRLSNSFLDDDTNTFLSLNDDRNIVSSSLPYSKIKLMIKNYNNYYLFFFSKEITRIYNNRHSFTTLFFANIVISIVSYKYMKHIYIFYICVYLVFFITDNVLSFLNKNEKSLKDNGFYIPHNLFENIKLKIFPQFLISFCFLSFLILVKFSFIELVFLSFIFSIRNILLNFSRSKVIKYISYSFYIFLYFLIST